MNPSPDIAHSASQGLMAVGFSASLLAMLWKRHWAYAAFSLLALVETFQRWRFPFHAWARMALLGTDEKPGAKEALQSTMMYVTAMLAVVAFILLVPILRRADNGARTRATGAAIILAVFTLEVISLHQVDVFIYHSEGNYARSSIAYFIGAALLAGGALFSSRRVKRTRHLKV